MKKIFVTAAFSILCLVVTGTAAELDLEPMQDFGRPGPETEPTKVEVLMAIMDIDNINTATQTFHANIFIRLTWKDLRLKHSSEGTAKYLLDKIWHPTLQIMNEGSRIRKTFSEVATVQPDGTVNYRQRYIGTFTQPLELSDFPFDQHTFQIQLVSTGNTPNEVQFLPDKEFVDKGFPYAALISKNISLPDWEILEYKARNEPSEVFEGYKLNAYVFEFTAKRLVEYYFQKVIIPLFFIVMMSWVVFWIDPENAGTQIGVSTTSMLTLIAYRFAIGTHIPKVPYTTKLDDFIFTSTLIVFLALIQAVLTSTLALSKKEAIARKMDKISRIIFPFLFVTSAYLILFGQ